MERQQNSSSPDGEEQRKKEEVINFLTDVMEGHVVPNYNVSNIDKALANLLSKRGLKYLPHSKSVKKCMMKIPVKDGIYHPLCPIFPFKRPQPLRVKYNTSKGSKIVEYSSAQIVSMCVMFLKLYAEHGTIYWLATRNDLSVNQVIMRKLKEGIIYNPFAQIDTALVPVQRRVLVMRMFQVFPDFKRLIKPEVQGWKLAVAMSGAVLLANVVPEEFKLFFGVVGAATVGYNFDINSMAEKAKQAVTSVSMLCTSTSLQCNLHVAEVFIEMIKEKVKSYVKSFFDNKYKLFGIVFSAVLGYVLLRAIRHKDVPAECVTAYFKHKGYNIPNISATEIQAGEKAMPLVLMLTAMLSGYDLSKFTRYYRTVHHIFENTYEDVGKKIKDIINVCTGYVYGIPIFELSDLELKLDSIRNLLQRIELHKTKSKFLRNDKHIAAELYTALQDSYLLLKASSYTKGSVVLTNEIKSLQASIGKYWNIVVKTNVVYTSRKGAIIFMFAGKPGVGKDTCMKTVMSAAHNICTGSRLTDEDYFVRCDGNFGYEGYMNQKAVLYNEVGALLDPSVTGPQLLELLGATGKDPLPLQMAFEQKGTTYFNSRYAGVTTNRADMEDCGLYCPEAFNRRIPVPLEMFRGKKDFTKCDPGDYDGCWYFQLWQAYKNNPLAFTKVHPYITKQVKNHGNAVIFTFKEVVRMYADVITEASKDVNLMDVTREVNWAAIVPEINVQSGTKPTHAALRETPERLRGYVVSVKRIKNNTAKRAPQYSDFCYVPVECIDLQMVKSSEPDVQVIGYYEGVHHNVTVPLSKLPINEDLYILDENTMFKGDPGPGDMVTYYAGFEPTQDCRYILYGKKGPNDKIHSRYEITNPYNKLEGFFDDEGNEGKFIPHMTTPVIGVHNNAKVAPNYIETIVTKFKQVWNSQRNAYCNAACALADPDGDSYDPTHMCRRSRILDFIIDYKRVLAGVTILGFTASILGIGFGINAFYKYMTTKPEEQSGAKYEYRGALSKARGGKNISFQSGQVLTNVKNIYRKVMNQTFVAEVEVGDMMTQTTVMFVTPKLLAINSHCITSNAKSIMLYKYKDKLLQLGQLEFKIVSSHEDVTFCEIYPNSTRRLDVADITKYIVTKQELSDIEKGLIGKDFYRVDPRNAEGRFVGEKMSFTQVVCIPNVHTNNKVDTRLLCFPEGTNTIKGHCGTPYVLSDPKSDCRVVFGLHTALGSHVMVSPLYKEMVPKVYYNKIVDVPGVPEPADAEMIEIQGGFRFDDWCPRNTISKGTIAKRVPSASKTAYTVSRMFSPELPKLNVPKEIAIPGCVTIKGIKLRDYQYKYHVTCQIPLLRYVRDQEQKDPMHYLQGFHARFPRKGELRPLNRNNDKFSELLLGNQEMSVAKVDDTSSAGPLFVHGFRGKKVKTKGDLYKITEEGKVLVNKQLVSDYNEVLRNLQEGTIVRMFTMDLDKDEARKLKPVEIEPGNVQMMPVARKFYNTSCVMQLLLRKWFSPILAYCKKQSCIQGDSIGMSPHNGNIQLMYARVTKYNNLGMGDVSSNDFNTQTNVINRLISLAKCYYKDLTKKEILELETLVWSVFTRLHLVEKELYAPIGGTGSGVIITGLINGVSIYSIIVMIYEVLCIEYYQDYGAPLKYPFKDHVSLVTAGDDFAFSFSDEVRPFFNFKTLHDNCVKIAGIKLTPIHKDESPLEVYDWSEFELIQRKIIMEETNGVKHYHGALNKDCIFKALYFEKKSKTETPNEVLKSVMQTSALECMHHGESFFQWFEETFRPRYESVTGESWPCSTYEYYHTRWKSMYNHCCTMDYEEKFFEVVHSVKSAQTEIQSQTIRLTKNNAPLLAELESVSKLNKQEKSGVGSLDFDTHEEKPEQIQDVLLEKDYVETVTQQHTYKEPGININDFPFKDLTPELITRPYIIFNDDSFGSGTIQLNPTQLLIENPLIYRVMNNYSLWRGDLKLTFLVKSAPPLFGYLQIASIYGGRNITWANDEEVINSSDQYLMSISSTESMELTIPYKSYRPYYRVESPGLGLYHQLYIRNDVANISGGSASISFTILAEFSNPVFAGPGCVQIQADNRFKNAAETASYLAGLAGPVMSAATGTVPLLQTALNAFSSLPEGPSNSHDKLVGAQKDAESEGVKQSLYGSLSNNNNCTSNRLGGNQTMPLLHNYLGEPNQYMLKDIAQLPSVVFRGDVTSTGLVFSYDNSVKYFTWYSYLTRFYRLHCATIKLSIHIFSSPLVTARYSITSAYDEAVTVPLADNFEGPSQTFLARGDHVKTVLIPYHSVYTMLARRSDHYAVVNLNCIGSPNSVTPTITGRQKVIIYMSACSDAKFASPRHPLDLEIPPLEESKIEVQCSLRKIHREEMGDSLADVPYMLTGLSNPHETIIDLLRVWDDRLGGTDSNLNPSILPDMLNSSVLFNNSAILDQIGCLFYLSTGSVEFKVGYEDGIEAANYAFTLNSEVRTVPSLSDLRVGNGKFIGHTSVWPVADYTVPYVSRWPFQPFPYTTYGSTDRVQVNTTGPLGSYANIVVRAGEDYQLFMPQVLPRRTLWL